MSPLSATLCLLATLLCLSFVTAQPPNPPAPKEYYFEQTFDHFNSSDSRVFKQRYLVYDGYWTGENATAPIFFCPGGEADAMGGYNHNGFMFQLAKWVGAILLFPEHRFYGQSVPYSVEESYQLDNIQKLTIEQAMEDYVSIIQAFKQERNISSQAPLISFGGSYPGDLSVYLRVAYPNIIDAALASSAPLNYHTGYVDSGSFFKVITDDFSIYNQSCPNFVRKAFSILETATESWVQENLRLCEPPDDLRMIHLWIENAFATLGMEDYPYPLDGLPASPMTAACSMMSRGLVSDSSDEEYVSNLADTVGLLYNSTLDLTCFNISEEYYPCADITGCGGGVGDPDAMSWDYQSCTQLVSNVDTNNITDMFPPAPYNFTELKFYCEKKWKATPQPNYTLDNWPYLNSSRIIFSNGLLDPWWPGGFLNNTNDTSSLITLLIPKAAHHLDLRGSAKEDPEEVGLARAKEAGIILRWIKEITEEKEN